MKLKRASTVVLVMAISIAILISCSDNNEFKSVSEYGQFAPADAYEYDSNYAYYGSENEWNRRMFSEKAANRFYKRRGQRQLLAILDGNPKRAIELCKSRLAENENDPETFFILTIAYSQIKQVDNAYETMIKALDNGLPFERFLAGPKDLLDPLYKHEKFIELSKQKNINLVHGPLLGSITETSAIIWLRTADESQIKIKLYDESGSSESILEAYGNTQKENDYTSVIKLVGLKPDKIYYYNIFINENLVNRNVKYFLKTYPGKNQRAVTKVGFGGGAGYTPQHERIWNNIADQKLDAFLLLGDNVYIDLPEQAGSFHQYTYYRRQSRPEFRYLVSSTPIYAIWDDHDSGTDDIWMGPYIDKPAWKLSHFQVFKQNWNNPGYGVKDTPGCWYKFSIGDIDFFMIDGRFYRTNPYAPNKTMLGPVQKQWLLRELKKSTAMFKAIVSPVPWSLNAKPGSVDTWAGFAEEREEIFSFIEKKKIEGIVLVSADRHRSDAWKIERKNGYDFYEFQSSRLTNIHTHDLMPDALFGYNEKCSFGTIEFNTTINNPYLVYKIFNIDGDMVGETKVKLSQLIFN